jgi:cytochrome c553
MHGRLPCGECHGADGAGKLVVDAQPVWTWYAPNITRGGVTQGYSGRDWDRIVRHGVKPDGTPATMPAIDFMSLSDQEVSDLAAYFQSLPPSATVQPPTVLGPIGKALIGFGKMPISAEEIDHSRDHALLPPVAEVGVEFGAHVAATCVGCHRTDFSGGPIAQGPPDWPPAGNLTPHEEGLASWSEEDFIRAIREAKRPDGTELLEPMNAVTKLNITDIELRAMFAYLKQLPAKPTGE